jgi:hypothetical protein
LRALELEKHPGKTFIGRNERGFDFLGYHFSPVGLAVAKKTVANFIEKASRLFELERRTPSAVRRFVLEASRSATGKSDRARQPWCGGANAFRTRSMASSLQRGTLRTAGLIGAAFAGLVIAGGSTVYAAISPGCDSMTGALNDGSQGPGGLDSPSGSFFTTGDTIRIIYADNPGRTKIVIYDMTASTNLAGPQSTNLTYTFPRSTTHIVNAAFVTASGRGSTAIVSCTPGAGR